MLEDLIDLVVIIFSQLSLATYSRAQPQAIDHYMLLILSKAPP